VRTTAVCSLATGRCGVSYSGGVAKSGTARAERSEREQRLAAMRRAQEGRERRRRLALVIGAGVLALVLVATVVVTIVRQQRAQDPANIGLSASAAACQPEETVPVDGVAQHVGPGTTSPDTLTVEYDRAPAVSGQHYVQPAYPAAPFYTAEDRPPIEQLVHNLEHGYTIAWYTSALPDDQVADLEAAAEAMRRDEATQRGKFIAAPWDEARGAFPGDATLALAHWGAVDGTLQYCGGVSGQVFEDFVQAHPASDSPEPNAA
jgi:hypothetical protein